MRFSITRYPGVGKRLLDCDVCGRKIRLEDAVRINDPYNLLDGMLVCKQDADKTNPQAIPFKIQETLATSPQNIRPQPADRYAINPNDNRAPSAPRNLRAFASPLGSSILLTWEGSFDVGTSPIIGYEIEIAEPQHSLYVVLETNTYSEIPFYEDTVTPVSSIVTYRIRAINSFGSSPYSNEAPYPADVIPDEIVYISSSQDDAVLQTGDGDYLIL